MKDMIIQQLKEKVGLSEDLAKKAADVVVDLIESKGGDLLGGAGGVADKVGDLAGGLLGKK